MKQKINVAELLKDYPQDMELDCTMYEDVYFDYIDEFNMIHCYIQRKTGKTSVIFNQHGTPNYDIKSKCVIFPKGKTTWEGFVPPVEFKDGDVLTTDTVHFIFKSHDDVFLHCNMHCHYSVLSNKFSISDDAIVNSEYVHPATKEQCNLLFQKIKESGYEWNEETKTLEKLIKPKFKVGDRIKSKINQCEYTITDIRKDVYIMQNTTDKFGYHVPFRNEDIFDLVSDKFDITALKPFDKVLVRDNDRQEWSISLFSHYNGLKNYKYSCINGNGYAQCIPYEANKELLGTNNNPE